MMEDTSLPQHFLSQLYDLYQQCDLCDVVLRATPGDGGDGAACSINLHSVILAAHSPVFRTLFNRKRANKNRWFLSVRGENMKHWRLLVRFMYSGHIELTADNVDAVHQLAGAYGMDRVKSLCETFRKSHRDITGINCQSSAGQEYVNLREIGAQDKQGRLVEVSFIKQELTDGEQTAQVDESCDIDVEVFYAHASGRTINLLKDEGHPIKGEGHTDQGEGYQHASSSFASAFDSQTPVQPSTPKRMGPARKRFRGKNARSGVTDSSCLEEKDKGADSERELRLSASKESTPQTQTPGASSWDVADELSESFADSSAAAVSDISLMMEVEDEADMYDDDTDNDPKYTPYGSKRRRYSSATKRASLDMPTTSSQATAEQKKIGTICASGKMLKGHRQCCKCSFTARDADVIIHERNEHGIPIDHPDYTVLSCSQEGCSFETLTESLLQAHIAGHNAEKQHCGHCGLTLSRLDMVSHMKEKHPQCDQCGLSCPTPAALQVHIKTQHANEGPEEHLCSDCGYLAWNDFSLAVHMHRIHSAPLPAKYAELLEIPPLEPPKVPKKRQKYTRLNIGQKKSIIMFKDCNPKMSHINLAKYFSAVFGSQISKTAINTILHSRAKYLNSTAHEDSLYKKRKRKYEKLEEMLYQWYTQLDAKIQISDVLLKAKARHISKMLNMDEEIPCSNGWLYGFKKRFNISSKKTSGNSAGEQTEQTAGGSQMHPGSAKVARPASGDLNFGNTFKQQNLPDYHQGNQNPNFYPELQNLGNFPNLTDSDQEDDEEQNMRDSFYEQVLRESQVEEVLREPSSVEDVRESSAERNLKDSSDDEQNSEDSESDEEQPQDAQISRHHEQK